MELKEFVRLDPNQVRRDKELMQLFVDFYEAAFSFIPKCVGCAFKSGFKKLKKYAESNNKIIKFDKIINIMESKTFVLKNQYKLKILTYKKDGVIHRAYGYNLTEEFAKELVKAGKTELFSKLPESKSIISGAINEVSKSHSDFKPTVIVFDSEDYYNSLNHQKELLPLYSSVKERTGKKALSNKKSDIIAFLIENES